MLLVWCSNRRRAITYVSQLLRQLHWLKARERIDFLLVLIVYTSAITEQQRRYLADELRQQANLDVVYVPLHRRR